MVLEKLVGEKFMIPCKNIQACVFFIQRGPKIRIEVTRERTGINYAWKKQIGELRALHSYHHYFSLSGGGSHCVCGMEMPPNQALPLTHEVSPARVFWYFKKCDWFGTYMKSLKVGWPWFGGVAFLAALVHMLVVWGLTVAILWLTGGLGASRVRTQPISGPLSN